MFAGSEKDASLQLHAHGRDLHQLSGSAAEGSPGGKATFTGHHRQVGNSIISCHTDMKEVCSIICSYMVGVGALS